MKEFFLVTSVLFLVSSALAQVKRPRGVAISKASFYPEGEDFTCLDGSLTIDFNKINDDYCDCPDGSDEPGTAACPNGSFHCTNAGYKPKYIPSSRVNDAICDCCDGSDEYDGKVTCANYCKELGKQMREEMEKKRSLLLEGYELYKEYVHKGTEARKEKQSKVDELRAKREELKQLRDDLENKKKEAEEPEKEAKDKHKAMWEEKKAAVKAERNKQAALEVFNELDTNDDNLVTVDEMQTHMEFDIDNGGDVSPEEAREYLEDHPEVNFDVFLENVWENIKEIYRKPGSDEKAKLKQKKKKKRDLEKKKKLKRALNLEKLRAEHVRLMQEEAALYEDPGSQFQSYKLDKNNPEELEANQLKMQEDLEKQQRKNELLKELEEAEAMVEEEAWTPTPTPWQNEDESEQAPPTEAPPTTEAPPHEEIVDPDEYADEDDDHHFDDEEEFDDEDEDEFPSRNFPRGDLGDDYIPDYDPKYDPTRDEDKKEDDDLGLTVPEYDEETKRLVEIAEQARQDYEEANSQFNEIDRELSETEKILGLDLGPSNEFYPLRGECYEFTDREYTYKLCPFDKATQRNKHGGVETTLGHWGKFDGPDNKKYTVMKYEKGQNCYHGPDRMCIVKIECGIHNELKNSVEPNRCEYEYTFSTPAACREPPQQTFDPLHDEL